MELRPLPIRVITGTFGSRQLGASGFLIPGQDTLLYDLMTLGGGDLGAGDWVQRAISKTSVKALAAVYFCLMIG